jgi:uncharacterized membrane protein affecting hemolysin expression
MSEKGDALSQFFFLKFALEDAMRWVQIKQDVSKLNVHISTRFMLVILIRITVLAEVYRQYRKTQKL